jgi:Tfp pilus assembly protein PilO
MKPRDRKALILLVLALAIYAGTNTFVLPAYDRIANAKDVAADKENLVRRYRRAELRKGQYADLMKTAADRVTQSETVVITAPNLSLVSAEFQSLVEDAAKKVGLVVGQRTVGTPKALNDFYAELPLTISFESTPGQLVSFLNEIRNIPRFMTINSLQVSPTDFVVDPPKGMAVSKNIRVSMTLYSLVPAAPIKPENGKK